MPLLSKEQIFSAPDLATEDVPVPEWGTDAVVRVRGLTGTERDAFEASIVDGKGKVSLANIRAKLVTRTAIDDQGNRLFDDTDVGALGRKSAAALARVFDVAQRLSGMSKEDIEELKNA